MKKIILFLAAFCVGGAALGLGLSVGNSVAQHFLPTEEIITKELKQIETSLTTVRVNPTVVPVDTQEPSFVDIIPEAKASVVNIYVTGPMGHLRRDVPGSGSGFIFAEDDEFIYIATNNHVIENTNSIFISLDETEQVAASVVGHDRSSDVAVIAASRAEMEEMEISYVVARLGDSDALRMGDSVIAIGNAMGEGQTVTRGIISALSLNIEIPDRRDRLSLDVLQTDAAVNRGNSGGPLVNQNGEVIGIVTAKLIGSDIEGMGYALPINNVLPLLTDIMETGSVRRTWLGVGQLEEISEFIRGLFNLPSTGVLVRHITEDSPAEEAGLLSGDLIIQFNERRIHTIDDLQYALENSRPGEKAILQIYRDGVQKEIPVVLGARMH